MQKALRNDSKVSFNEFSLYQRKNLSLYLKNIFYYPRPGIAIQKLWFQ